MAITPTNAIFLAIEVTSMKLEPTKYWEAEWHDEKDCGPANRKF